MGRKKLAPGQRKQNVTVRMSPAMLERVELAAKQWKCSHAEVVRIALVRVLPRALACLLVACSTVHDLPDSEAHDAGGLDTIVADGSTPPCGRDEVSNTCKLTLTYDRWVRAADAPAQCPAVLYQDERVVLHPPACSPAPTACAWRAQEGEHYTDDVGNPVETEVLVYRDQASGVLDLTVVFDGVRCVYR